MTACVECNSVIAKGNECVKCAGECGKVWHVHCSGLSKSGVHGMCENSALVYVCFDCRKSARKGKGERADKSTRSNDAYTAEMKVALQELLRDEFKVMSEILLTAVENRIKNVLESELTKEKLCSITGSGQFSAVNGNMEWSKVVASGVSGGNVRTTGDGSGNVGGTRVNGNLSATSATGGNLIASGGNQRNTDGGGSVLRNGKRRRMNVDIPNTNDSGGNLTPRIECQTPRNGGERPLSLVKLDETVSFKPIKSQDIEITKKEIKSSLDPVKVGVKSLRFIESTGEAFIRCQSIECAATLMKEAQKSLGGKYKIEIKKPNKPKVKIVGHEEEENDNGGVKFVERLKKQNGLNENADIKVVKTSKNVKWKHNPMISILEVDANTFETLIRRGKVNIGWERCRVFEVISVLRCFKCWGYGHKFEDCKEITCCPRCAECHELNECSSDYDKCVNCDKYNKKLKLDADRQLDCCHPVWSYECPIYKNKEKRAKQLIDYNA